MDLPATMAVAASALADVNGDGIPDLILSLGSRSSKAGLISVYLGTGDGTFKLANSGQVISNTGVVGFTTANLRGTGAVDLVEVYAVSTGTNPVFGVQVSAGNGDGTFQTPVPVAFPPALEPWPLSLVAGDWNGDGLADLAFAALPAGFNESGTTATGLQGLISALESIPAGNLVTILNGLAPAPALSVSKSQLQFAAASGSVAPSPQSVAIANSGTGKLSWTATANSSWLVVSPSSGTAPSNLVISVSPGTLAPATYTGTVQIAASGAVGSPRTIAVSLTISPATNAPFITGVVNGASFQPGFESGSWVTIQGVNLSNTNPGRTWTASEIVNGSLPTSLDNTSVTIDGKRAFVYYISPTQLNVQAPTDSATGSVAVVVTNNGLTSTPYSAQISTYSPAFFLYSGTNYAIATNLNYSLVGNPNAIPGTISAHPGDLLILWATGFGPTSPPTPAGIEVTGAPSVATPPTITVGGVPASLVGTPVLSPGSAGLYQVAIQLPSTVPTGVVSLQAAVGGVVSPVGVSLYVSVAQ
jgi:uncharacterized protein (TIGR03437 family)